MTLTNCQVLKTGKVQKVHPDTVITLDVKPNATKELKIAVLHKQVGIDESNICTSTRVGKAKDILDL